MRHNDGPPETLCCGVDLGACATKLVLLDGTASVLARVVRPSGVDYTRTARDCLDAALAEIDRDTAAVAYTVGTGYGRSNVDFADTTSTEIHCHGIGAYHHLPQAITVIDIGGQDNKVIRLAEDGRRVDFKMNRKCAAGTGAFIEEIALRLGIEASDMDRLAASAEHAVRLSSFCTVFASTEILAHLRKGVTLEALVRGVFQSVVDRVVEMGVFSGPARQGVAPEQSPVVLSGGVIAHNPIIAELLGDKLGRPVTIAPHPQFIGALGAALTALRSLPESTQQVQRQSKEDQDA